MLDIDPLTIKVVEGNPHADPRWESFIVGHPNALIYHHPLWLKALEQEYGQRGVYLTCVNAEGQILAVLPMFYTRGLPFKVATPLTGRRLSSLPRTPLTGPLSTDSRATVALLREAICRVSREPGTRLQIKTQGLELKGLVDELACKPWRLSYVLELPSDVEGPFRIGDRKTRAAVQWALNKAKRSSVSVRPAETEAELGQWYELYLDTMRRNVVPSRPYRFFSALWSLLRPRGMMQLLLAEQNVAGHRTILGGSIFLMFGQTVSYAFNGTRLHTLGLRPNDIVQWEAINDAYKRGFRFMDFGEVPEGNDGLARFKSKWGATPTRLYRYYYPDLPSKDSGVLDLPGHLGVFARAVWPRVPLKATEWLGDWTYSYL